MRLQLSPEEESFRQEMHTFFTTQVPESTRQAVAAHRDLTREQWVESQRILNAAGLAVPHWPTEWGGRDWTPLQRHIWREEMQLASVPEPLPFNAGMIGPVLAAFGSQEQKERFLPATANLDIWWCQGFSEPEAGSDLASLRTSARRDGDSYVVNGQKLWASGGKHADWCLLLARTDPEAPKRKGISYFLLDMTTPGVEVRPIRNAIGDAHFCEIFLNDVEIPAANLVGVENAGWQVAQATLGAERGLTMLELAERLGNAGFRWLVEASPVDDPIVADRLAQFETEITGLRGLCRKVVEDNETGTAGPADASIVKLYYSELLQRLTDFGAEIGGLPAHTRLAKPMSSGWESGSWMLDFIGSWEWTIPGGSSEVQRTIIGERALGLPREPSAV